jgi:hypothetical protein
VTLPKEVEITNRLESILSPYAVSQMQEFVKKQADQAHVRFVHYTSAEAGLRIIEKKRIWMRNVTCMPDYKEVHHGYGILLNLFREKSNRQMFNEAIDACAPGAAEEAFKLFDRGWNDISLDTYITAISEYDEREDPHGRLSMWRAFGGSAARVALVFKVPVSLLTAGVFNLVFSPVAYLTDQEVRDQFGNIVQNVRANCDFLRSVGHQRLVTGVLNMLVAGVTCLKHPGFREEREWRLIYGPKRWPSSLIELSTEVVYGIPQVIYRIPFDGAAPGVPSEFDLARLFDRLIIGPSQYPWSMVEAYVLALRNAGVAEPQVVPSNIPIRL